jgi:hypothetical protein
VSWRSLCVVGSSGNEVPFHPYLAARQSIRADLDTPPGVISPHITADERQRAGASTGSFRIIAGPRSGEMADDAAVERTILVQIALQCESANSQPFEFVGLYRSTLR